MLASSNLPTDDLRDTLVLQLFGCKSASDFSGIVGLELYGSNAMLRSLAVADSQRGHGLGAALVLYAEQYAREHGVDTVYLLTNTADKFFKRRGYSLTRREDAPDAISLTRQFSGLCPATATFMSKCVR